MVSALVIFPLAYIEKDATISLMSFTYESTSRLIFSHDFSSGTVLIILRYAGLNASRHSLEMVSSLIEVCGWSSEIESAVFPFYKVKVVSNSSIFNFKFDARCSLWTGSLPVVIWLERLAIL